MVEVLFDAEPNVHTVTDDGCAPLHAVAMEGHAAVAEVLLDAVATADTVWKEAQGTTPHTWPQSVVMRPLRVALTVALAVKATKSTTYKVKP